MREFGWGCDLLVGEGGKLEKEEGFCSQRRKKKLGGKLASTAQAPARTGRPVLYGVPNSEQWAFDAAESQQPLYQRVLRSTGVLGLPWRYQSCSRGHARRLRKELGSRVLMCG